MNTFEIRSTKLEIRKWETPRLCCVLVERTLQAYIAAQGNKFEIRSTKFETNSKSKNSNSRNRFKPIFQRATGAEKRRLYNY
jgi:hypothetical protein